MSKDLGSEIVVTNAYAIVEWPCPYCRTTVPVPVVLELATATLVGALHPGLGSHKARLNNRVDISSLVGVDAHLLTHDPDAPPVSKEAP